jgi:hypothetical protein
MYARCATALSTPQTEHPLAERTGDPSRCMMGQHGNIWFFGGTLFTGGGVERSCQIPQGTNVFFPVADSVDVNTPDICGQVGSLTVAELRALVAQFVDGVTEFSVTYDGKEVRQIPRRGASRR